MSSVVGRTRRTLLLAAFAFTLSMFAAATASAQSDFDGDGSLPPADCAPLDGAIAPGKADKPDLNFVDSNCDGIDGNISKAVFVSASAANDAGSGSKENPLKTISVAIAKAKAEGKDVYVITGTYEQGTINLDDNVGLFGGYVLVTGARSTTEKSIIKAPQQAILGDNDTGVVLQKLHLEPSTPAGTGQSSYGVRAVNGSSIVVQAVTSTSTAGTAGGAGSTPTSFLNNGAGGGRGNDGTACPPNNSNLRAAGGPGGNTVFFGIQFAGFNGATGGIGGGSFFGQQAGANGATGAGPSGGTPGSGGNSNGAVGGPGSPAGNAPTGRAANGGDGANAAFPATTNSAAWAGSTGGGGAAGASGSGGGSGGGGGTGWGATIPEDAGGGGGGGGGEGGGGGAGAGGGAGGGGSFGVFAHNSVVVVDRSALTTGNGGVGGNGALGETGGTGGTGGDGGNGATCGARSGGNGGKGGNGQPGGNGGVSGGGTGGPSFGIYRSGTAKYVDRSNTIATGTPGLGGFRGGTLTRAASGQAARTGGGGPAGDVNFDGDGFTDNVDNCPEVAGTDQGCVQLGQVADADGDGIPDSSDSCPNEARGNTDNNGDGCPDAPPPPVIITQPPSGGTPDPTQIVIRMPFFVKKSTNRFTTFTQLQVKGIPINSTLKAVCKSPKKGKKCPGGSTFTKRNAFGTVNLKKWLKKKLLAGTKLTVTVTKAGNFIGAVKIMTVRKKARPKFTDRCLPPGAKRPVGC